MAAPDFVPTDPQQRVRSYSSPPRRPDSWTADRPGEIVGPQPVGERLGTTGPDQGYAYRLVPLIADRLHLGNAKKDDVVAGCVALAMKRSALFGRAPVIHDLTVAFTTYGFLDANPAPELVELREDIFAEVRSSHHYSERRELVDRVPDDVLKRTPDEVSRLYTKNWRRVIAADGSDAS